MSRNNKKVRFCSKIKRVILILHGFNGSSGTKYVRNLIYRISENKIYKDNTIVMGVNNPGIRRKTQKITHIGYVDDLEDILLYLQKKKLSVSMIGFSLGGAQMTKVMGKIGMYREKNKSLKQKPRASLISNVRFEELNTEPRKKINNEEVKGSNNEVIHDERPIIGSAKRFKNISITKSRNRSDSNSLTSTNNNISVTISNPIDDSYVYSKLSRLKLKCCIGICVPFNFTKIYANINGIIQKAITKRFKRFTSRNKIAYFKDCNTLEEINLKIAKHLKYKNSEEYYTDNSCIKYLDHLMVPTMFINALDDLLVSRNSQITNADFDNDNITLVEMNGGHVGFIDNWWTCYSEKIVLEFLNINV